MDGIPPLGFATVIAQVPVGFANGPSLQVLLDGPFAGGGVLTVDVGSPGPRDQMRGHYGPLPTPGTRGVVAFPRGDMRVGVWLCAVSGPSMSANPRQPGVVSSDSYTAYWSGLWHYRNENGREQTVWPDGTAFLVGFDSPSPPGRWTIGADQKPQYVGFSQAQRVADPPGAFQLRIVGAAGWLVDLRADGDVVLTCAGGASIGMSGTVVTVTGELRATGAITAGYGGAGQVGVTTHDHSDVQPGGGSSGPPVPGT